MYEEYLTVAKDAALAVTPMLQQAFGNTMEIRTKESVGDYVTEYDVAAEQEIVKRIRAAFPKHSIFAEEQTDIIGTKDACWLIDPIDGTSNFTLSIPWFCTSIALVIGGQTVVGVIMHPITGELIWATRGGGAFIEMPFLETRLTVARELKVSTIADLHEARVNAAWWSRRGEPEFMLRGIATFNNFAEFALKMRYLSSTALDMVHVARGHFDVATSDGRFLDIAAAKLIVEEAGGKVTDGAGNVIDPKNRSTQRFVSTNGILHSDALRLVRY